MCDFVYGPFGATGGLRVWVQVAHLRHPPRRRVSLEATIRPVGFHFQGNTSIFAIIAREGDVRKLRKWP